jgi:hypothetical protein
MLKQPQVLINSNTQILYNTKYMICTTNHLSWTGIPYSLSPTKTPHSFCNDGEHGKAIDAIISMMKNGNGDIQTIKPPDVMINGNTLKYL